MDRLAMIKPPAQKVQEESQFKAALTKKSKKVVLKKIKNKRKSQ